MGRKPSPNPRNKRIQIPVTAAELERIRVEAKDRGREVASWLRDDLALPEVAKGEKRRARAHP